MGSLIPLIHSVKLFLRQTYITVGGGDGGGGRGGACAVAAEWCGASVCPLWACHSAGPSQLPGSGWVKQHLSSGETPLC